MANNTSMAATVFYTGNEKLREGRVSWIIEDMIDKINNFEPGQFLKTDTITIMDSKWFFRIYPNGRREKGKIEVGVLMSGNDQEITAGCEFSVGQSEHGWFKTKNYKNWKFLTRNPKKSTRLLTHNEVFENKERVISFGKMEFSMKVTLEGDGKTCAQVDFQKETVFNSFEIEGLRELSQNFTSLLWDEASSDFRITCGDESFPVHRVVLEARSSYFQGLFNSGFVETETGQVNIEDMSSETVKFVIEFLYTGKFKDMGSKAVDLLVAADRLDLPLLKKFCELWILSNLKKENAVDLFVLADEHNSVKLRAKAKQMIVENSVEIIKQDGYRAKLGTLVFELFEALSNSK